ncbi:MAG: MobA/MobL family protein [Pseudomonadota bacterium]|nr:MobA/MobL family protein [Pseudomonadota bacterium]
MAIYHLSMKTISRGQGRSATAAIAYRAGVEIADRRTGEVHDYTRKRGVVSDGKLRKQGRAAGREQVERIRQVWEQYVNQALERAGVEQRVDHRSLEAQGIERLPTIHLGVHAVAMERRGVHTSRED